MKFIFAYVLIYATVASAMEVWEGKRYTLCDSSYYNDYLRELGVGYNLRAFVVSISIWKPTIELKNLDDNKYMLTTEPKPLTTSSDIIFELDKSFDEDLLSGNQVKSVITKNGNKFVHKQNGYPPSTIVYEFNDKEMIATMIVSDVICTRKFCAQ